jgi:hypothetical protein
MNASAGSGYSLAFTTGPGYLRADVTGTRDSVEISTAYWSEIAERCRATSVRRLLVVENIEQRSTLGDTIEVIDALVAMGFRDIRIAYVDLHEDAALLSQTEFLAARAGMVGRVFADTGHALDWLLQGPQQETHGS